MKDLFRVTAREGSKGVPRKNIKLLGDKPLINYTVEVARSVANDEDICVTTDDLEIKDVVEQTGLIVPFLRPKELATDNSGTYEVLLHALDFYKSKGRRYDRLILLQPTSPFREQTHVQEALSLWEEGIEMIVSVKETRSNPYYILFEENENGFLTISKEANFTKRQDCPAVYEYNGAIYVIDLKSLKVKPLSSFTRKKKYVMDEASSLDIDSPLDWKFAEFLIKNNLLA